MTTPARRQSTDALERFDTPAWMTGALLWKVPRVGAGGDVLEPMAGNGAIVEVLERHYRRVRAFDLEPRRQALPLFGTVRDVGVRQADATEAAFWSQERLAGVSWCVTNPAFSLATIVLGHARAAGLRAAFLLRLNALEPTEDRAPWLRDDPPSDLVLLPRGSFTGEGGDTAPAFWFVWRAPKPRPGQATRLLVLTPAERAELAQIYHGGWKRRRTRRRTTVGGLTSEGREGLDDDTRGALPARSAVPSAGAHTRRAPRL